MTRHYFNTWKYMSNIKSRKVIGTCRKNTTYADLQKRRNCIVLRRRFQRPTHDFQAWHEKLADATVLHKRQPGTL